MSAIAWPIRAAAIGLVIYVSIDVPAAAGPFSSLVVFGDSLSDVGNIDNATPFFFKYPGQYYYQGRFSNGPVWVEALATGLGLPTIAASTDSGNNFAYGGAQTAGTGGIAGGFILDVNEQVTQYLATRTVDPNELYLVFAGANDLVGDPTKLNSAVSQLASDVGRLIAAGARQFLIPNLPPLGFTPRFNEDLDNRDDYNGYSATFNSQFAARLDTLAGGTAGVTFHELDVFNLFNQARANPAAFGLINVEDAAAPGLEPGPGSYNTSLIAAEPNKYLFWDDLHPTAAVHAILAERALSLLLTLAGDYNGDHTVNSADYTVWRNTLGQTGAGLAADGDGDRRITRLDYDVWRMHFGETGGFGAGAADAATIPEPAGGTLVVLALIIFMLTARSAVAL